MNSRCLMLIAALFSITTTGVASNSAWMYANQPSAPAYTPNPAHSHNPSGGAITVQHAAAPGVYRIIFANLVPVSGTNVNIQVTAAGNGTANCHVMDWVTAQPPDLVTHVRCYKTDGGATVDSEFTLLVTFP